MADKKSNSNNNSRRNPKRQKFSPDMQLQQNIAKKAVVLSAGVLLLFVFLVVRVVSIMRDNGEQYKKQVLAQQQYDSVIIPYQRGAILDRNGTMLAYSERVYNVILDCHVLTNDNSDGKSTEPTINAAAKCLGLNASDLRLYIQDNPEARYHILVKNLSYEAMENYLNYVAEYNADIAEQNKTLEEKLPRINDKAIWFEDQFRRTYPGGTLACDVIGFTTKDGQGQYGLEEYYNDVLMGRNGREYGYLTAENALERTVIPAENGHTLVTSIDSYIQRVCEEKIREYNLEHAGEWRENEMGSDNTGVIIMDIHTGEILAMASYPYFDLNDPWDMSMYSEGEVERMIERADGDAEKASQSLWKNFCISQSYEPGSVCKTFTVAMALDMGVIHDGDRFTCHGYLQFGEGEHTTTIRCHQRYGDGDIDVKTAVEKSCNVALMLIGQKVGKENFLQYQKNFNFGLRTNVDLAGEMRTASLVFNERTMGVTELMTSTFGQGFNVTMIQTIAAYASLVNGGYYYQPHVVTQILDDNGAVVENIEPKMLRQVVSEHVSDLMIDYCIGVVDEGTGTRARPAGYRIGGKTGTAERSGQGKRDYTVSFMGFAPADDPQIAIYVVIDRPNTGSQEFGTRYACLLCRDILTEVLPYMHIFMTEPLSPAEEKELEERGQQSTLSENSASENSASENSASENTASENEAQEEIPVVELNIDPSSGMAIDPINHELLDPQTGAPLDEESSIFQDENGNAIDIPQAYDPGADSEDPRE